MLSFICCSFELCLSVIIVVSFLIEEFGFSYRQDMVYLAPVNQELSAFLQSFNLKLQKDLSSVNPLSEVFKYIYHPIPIGMVSLTASPYFR